MYGIFTYIYHKNQLDVGKCTIHGCYGVTIGGYVIPFTKIVEAHHVAPNPRFIAAGLWVARWQHRFQPPFFWSKEGTMGEGENQLQHMNT